MNGNFFSIVQSANAYILVKSIPKENIIFQLKKEIKWYLLVKKKYLGVIFDTTLKSDLHIESMIKKANSMLGLIKRNFSFIDMFVFLKLYKALIRPHLEYGQIIWSPKFKRQSKIIENVQRRATKIIPNLKHLPYDERLKILKLPTLKFRRLRGDLINVYKILANEKSSSKHLLPLNNSKYNTRGHDRKLENKTDSIVNCVNIPSPHWVTKLLSQVQLTILRSC